METMGRSDVVEAPLDKQILTLKKRDRWLAWLAGILAIAVVAMGAWMIFGGDGGHGLTAQQEQTLDDFRAAWNAGDGEAVAAIMMPSGYHDNGITRYPVADGELADFVETMHALGLEVQDDEERRAYGDFVVSYSRLSSTETERSLAIVKMTPDGTRIFWHLAP